MAVYTAKKISPKLSLILNSPFLLVFLGGLYPAIFKVSNNWYLLQGIFEKQTAILLIIPPVIALATCMCCYFILLGLQKIASFVGFHFSGTLTSHLIKIIACTFFSCLFFIIYIGESLRNPMLWLTGEIFRFRFILIIFILIAWPLVFLYAQRVGIKYLNLIALGLCAFLLISLAFNYVTKPPIGEESFRQSNQGANSKIVVSNFRIKSNVYLIVPDAYTNDAVLKKQFRLNNSPFVRALEDKGFCLYDNSYSNYNNTLASMQSIFSMQHHYYKHTVGNGDSIVARNLIAANVNNPVIETFKRNNYKIFYILDSTYLCPTPDMSIDRYISYGSYYLVTYFYPLFFELVPFAKPSIKPAYVNGAIVIKKNRRLSDISTLIDDGHPFFMFIHMDSPGHADTSLPYGKLAPFESAYPINIEETNSVLIEMIDLIATKDPNAFIIISGDHGPYRYGNTTIIDNWGLGTKNIKERIRQLGFEQEAIGMDMFGILLAIRYPKQYDRRFDDVIISPVNLFRYVFAVLHENDSILAANEKNSSYVLSNELLLVVSDGKPLKEWQDYKEF